MLKTNSKEVKNKVRTFILGEIKETNESNLPDIEYLKQEYKESVERVKGTRETPAENLVNTCTEFFKGDYEIFETVQSWTESNYEPTDKNINKAVSLYTYLLDREIQFLIK